MTTACDYATFRPTEAPTELVPLGARSVGHHTVPGDWADNSFRVKHAVLLWGIRGEGLMRIGTEDHRIGAETIGVLLPGQMQELRAGGQEWEYCWWTVDGPQVKPVVSGFGFREGTYVAGPAPTVLIAELEAVIKRPGRRHELESSAIAYELLCRAARYTRPVGRRQIEDPLVNAAVDTILRSWQDGSFGVEALAATLDTHRSSLSRRFKRATGSTLLDYINSLRMHHAGHLLRHSELSVGEIARECGFNDANYFSKRFHARFGESPSSVRRER